MKIILFVFIISAALITACGPGRQDNGPAHDRHTPSDSARELDTDPKNDPDGDTTGASGTLHSKAFGDKS